MAFKWIPREERFFDDFVAVAEQIRNGAILLEDVDFQFCAATAIGGDMVT